MSRDNIRAWITSHPRLLTAANFGLLGLGYVTTLGVGSGGSTGP